MSKKKVLEKREKRAYKKLSAAQNKWIKTRSKLSAYLIVESHIKDILKRLDKDDNNRRPN